AAYPVIGVRELGDRLLAAQRTAGSEGPDRRGKRREGVGLVQHRGDDELACHAGSPWGREGQDRGGGRVGACPPTSLDVIAARQAGHRQDAGGAPGGRPSSARTSSGSAASLVGSIAGSPVHQQPSVPAPQPKLAPQRKQRVAAAEVSGGCASGGIDGAGKIGNGEAANVV